MDEKRDGGVLLLHLRGASHSGADEDTHRVSRHFDHLVLTPPATAAAGSEQRRPQTTTTMKVAYRVWHSMYGITQLRGMDLSLSQEIHSLERDIKHCV